MTASCVAQTAWASNEGVGHFEGPILAHKRLKIRVRGRCLRIGDTQNNNGPGAETGFLVQKLGPALDQDTFFFF